MTTIHSPAKGFTGKTMFGPLEVEFKDGKATVEDLPDGVRQYLLGAGYKVGGTSVEQPEDVPPVDARDFAEPQVVGTKLRDAAVDPEPEDFLAPTNAGQADPHGPDVISPGVHAEQGVRPVKPGEVHVDDTDAQDAEETEHTVAATDGTPILDGGSPDDGESTLKGGELDQALEDAGLSKAGTADEKRARLTEHQGG